MAEIVELGRRAMRSLSGKFDEVAVMVTSKNYVMVKLWNSEPSIVQSWIGSDVGLYLARDRRVFELEVSVSNIEDILKVAEEIYRYSDKVKESELYAPLPKPQGYESLKGTVDSGVLKYMENPRPLAERMISASLDEGVDRVAGVLKLGVARKALVISTGFEGFEEGTEVEAYLRAFKGEYSGHWAYGSRHVDIGRVEEVGRKAGELAVKAGRKAGFTPGRYDVVLSPLVVGNLMNYVAFMASALHIIMGFSMFMKRAIGDRVGSEAFTLIDEPRNVELSGSASFDDEGVQTFNKPIISRGVLAGLLHNSKTAAKMKASTTGNAGWISPHPWNIEIAPGDYGEEEMVRELGRGVIITNNWYTRLQNYAEGIFSTVSRDAALLVEGGEVVGQVGRVRVADR
ncbi:MAG: peptidase U62, partial [Desulfurococcales archaeon ex4484_204]